jgi:short-chain fatty acids transporter
MNFEKILNGIKRGLPSPFSIAIFLTFISILLAFFLTGKQNPQNFFNILNFWETGFWELLDFAMQMMIMLVLGHVLAISPFISKLITSLISGIRSNSTAVVVTAISTMLLAYFNWALALIFGAIIARKIAEKSIKEGFKINYPLIAAAGYSGLMVWHGGFSGSAPLKVAESNHFLASQIGIIPIDKTILSAMNIFSAIAIITFVSLGLWILSKKAKTEKIYIKLESEIIIAKKSKKFKIDNASFFLRIFAVLMFLAIAVKIYEQSSFKIININFINFILFALALWFHKNVHNFLQALNTAIKGSVGILIQFPIYAGIMGIMKYSGLSDIFTHFFIQISNENSLPIYTFVSAGIVNIFVPSGGGQWAVQGPIIVEAAQKIGVPIHKIIMALAYGDEITNMMQPFWALPLLGITGLKAKDIFPYTLFMMLIGIIVFIGSLLLF